MIEILKKMEIKISNPEFDSTVQPFFFNDNSCKNIDLIEQIKIISNKEQLNSILNNDYFNKLPENIKEFYYLFNNINNEIYIHYWTFFSINNILKRYNEFYKKDNIYIIDIAYSYLGMGWIQILSYDPIKEKYIVRDDGGSNGFDREDNYKNLKDYCKNSSINHNFYKLSFNNFIDYLEYVYNNSLL